jgi:hypothetical protein
MAWSNVGKVLPQFQAGRELSPVFVVVIDGEWSIYYSRQKTWWSIDPVQESDQMRNFGRLIALLL